MAKKVNIVPSQFDKRGTKSQAKKKMYIRANFTDEVIQYWNETLDLVEVQLYEYLNSDKVQGWLNSGKKNGNGACAPKFTPKELIDKGMAYFRFTLKHKRNMAIYGMALHMGMDVQVITRMEQKNDYGSAYHNDIYKPIVRTFKTLVGLFHEEMGSDKINPNFNIFVLKALRNGFEESMDLNVTPQNTGLTDEERAKLRQQVKNFTENSPQAFIKKLN